MPPARKKSRRGGHRSRSGGIPGWTWLLGGILIGLGAAVVLMFKGYLPELKQNTPSADSRPEASSSALVEEVKEEKPRYEFFTVLPEMEVVVPEQELSRKAAPEANNTGSQSAGGTAGSSTDRYILQVGSFKSAPDAEQMKARLALMGSTATIQIVTVNGETWHRVRIGPFTGARAADEMRGTLAENRIDTLIMKVKE